MRVVVLGAGGVGSVVAGYLARTGYEVVMLARPGHTAVVQQAGLHICGLADFRVQVPVFADAQDCARPICSSSRLRPKIWDEHWPESLTSRSVGSRRYRTAWLRTSRSQKSLARIK